MSEVRARRTQQERRDETRGAILDAAVEALVELGHARTTTLEVQRRAGVSRGALLHHFPSKAELMAAAVRHLAWLRGRAWQERAAQLPAGGDRVAAVVDLLWESFNGPLFAVAMELRTAARTDDELRPIMIDVETDLRRHVLSKCRELLGEPLASRTGVDDALDATLQLMFGAAGSRFVHRDPRGIDGLIERWKKLFQMLMENG